MMASAGQPARTGPNAIVRIARAWRALSREQRVAALAAFLLFITMFLPWYSETVLVIRATPRSARASASAWSAFGLVQALVMAISLGTLVLLFMRGEQRALGGPSGDGAVIWCSAGGTTASLLILYAMFDRPGGCLALASGISWGIVIALLAAIWLAWTGRRSASAQRQRRRPAARPTGDAPDRLLTRRERRGDQDRRRSASLGSSPARRRARRPAATSGPQGSSAPERGARAAREDVTQLSLELPYDHFDE